MTAKVKVRYRTWIGKPDPCGFGFYWFHGTEAEVRAHITWVSARGHKPGRILKEVSKA